MFLYTSRNKWYQHLITRRHIQCKGFFFVCPQHQSKKVLYTRVHNDGFPCRMAGVRGTGVLHVWGSGSCKQRSSVTHPASDWWLRQVHRPISVGARGREPDVGDTHRHAHPRLAGGAAGTSLNLVCPAAEAAPPPNSTVSPWRDVENLIRHSMFLNRCKNNT